MAFHINCGGAVKEKSDGGAPYFCSKCNNGVPADSVVEKAADAGPPPEEPTYPEPTDDHPEPGPGKVKV